MTKTVIHKPQNAKHVDIYYNKNEFAAWPFNHGFWAFPGGELLLGFSRGPCNYSSSYDMGHSVVDAKGGEYVLIRSKDEGESWSGLQSLGSRQDIERPLYVNKAEIPAMDWSSPDFCLSAGFGIPPQKDQSLGYIQLSSDRGHSWTAPLAMPAFNFNWVQVKPDYLVREDGLILLFVTVGLKSGEVGQRFVAVYASPDNGQSWNYLAPIISTAPDSHFVNRYYASPVLLPDGRILVALRCQIDARNAWPELFESCDGGRSWSFVSRPSDWGGPSQLTRLNDGRLLIVYGYRVKPYGIRAKVSEDHGRSWGPEIILRDDAGSWDLGYPKTVELSGGRVMTAYYFNRKDDPIQQNGGVRHIAGTIFTP
ncbi:MAG: exo-alpha-sialidase [Trueperaceae bacterium]|nr:exo-alpha-sialidase [Trueperaceae bacterium]